MSIMTLYNSVTLKITMPLVLITRLLTGRADIPAGSHNGPQPSALGHYSCPQANAKAIPLQAIINI